MEDTDLFTWAAAILVGIIGFAWTIISQHKAGMALPASPSVVEQKADDKAAAETIVITKAHDDEVAQAKAEDAKENDQLVQTLETQEPKLVDDDTALTDDLLNVGKSVRGGG